MAIPLQPHVGQWYQLVGGELFEVVAIDPEEQSIEIQYFDGSLEELDSDLWDELPLVTAQAPQDWSRSMDISREDFYHQPEAGPRFDGYDFLDSLDR